ncbi:hypothetical protein C8Q70DRAFT_920440 [Cubamyces menziesii]|nr:hypothetical protein C8Q70DRAFT_920440 [Cubamyces menziesii]
MTPCGGQQLASDPYEPETQEDPNIVRRDYRFYSDHIVIQVENRLYKVPKRKFVDGSEVFRDMFALPTDSTTVEGQTDERPIVLENIKKDEFQQLLHAILYGPSYEEQKEPTMEDWISVLKLTAMWQFTKLRRVAIDKLTPLLKAADIPVRWLGLARQYDVHEWLFPALHALARRVQPIQLEEVESLGIATVIKMAEVRESFVGWTRSPNDSFHAHVPTVRLQYDFTTIIRRVFQDELKDSWVTDLISRRRTIWDSQ